MADYTDNNGTSYINRNVCRSFNTTLSTGLAALVNQVCSEVLVMNRTGQNINLFDNSYSDAGNALLLRDGESFILRGITNTNQLSAQTATGSGTLYYRTQYFGTNVLAQ